MKSRKSESKERALLMNKRGFLLIEVLTMFILLTIVFLQVYLLVDGYVRREKTSLYYNDIATLYSAHYTKEVLLRYTNIETWANTAVSSIREYGRVIGRDYPVNFFRSGVNVNHYNQITRNLNLHQIFLTNDMRGLISCARSTGALSTKCANTFMDEEMRAFIRVINLGELPNNVPYLILTFRMSFDGSSCRADNCFSHFTWTAI